MEEESAKDLFTIKLNKTGIHYIRKLVGLAGSIIVLFSIYTIVSIAEIIYWVIQIHRSSPAFGYDRYVSLLKASNYLLLIILIINLFCLYYFIKFIRLINRSITNVDEAGFNISFKYLYLNTLVYFCVLILDLFHLGFSLLQAFT